MNFQRLPRLALHLPVLLRGLLLVVMAVAAPVAKADDADCAPLGHIGTYASDASNEMGGKPERHVFGEHDFLLSAPGTGAPTTVQGAWCSQTYDLKAGLNEPAPQVIADHYKQELNKLGASLLYGDACVTTARLVKDGGETWMHINCAQGFASSYTVWVVTKTALKLSLTEPATDDYRLLGHMPGYAVVKSEKADAGDLTFPISAGNFVTVQGKRLHLDYEPKPGTQPAADLEIVQNYLEAMKAKGGELIYQDKTDLVARMPDGDHLVWVHVVSLFGNVKLDVTDEKSYQPVATPPKSDALKAALDQNGHIALYVNFDFAKASLKPDAAPVIAQVVALLKAYPGYKLSIEGHTDSVGDDAANQKLSEARAAAVVDAVVKGGIEKSRLSSAGRGESSPIADNAKSEGRAKNRRVELVKQ